MTKTSYTLDYAEGVAEDLAALRAYERKQILDAIEKHLTYEPTQSTRNKKILVGLVPPWNHVDPIWELRIGEYRIFYDVDTETFCVTVRAIRRKPPHKTTEEILW
jgi:mRNA-degrading endonuclease RelE of RelBE toxin-antitoxin system